LRIEHAWQYWCWIGSAFTAQRLALENIWLWLTFAVSPLYLALVFWIQGYVTPSEQTWWKFRIHSNKEMGPRHRQTRMTIYMLV